MIRKLKWTKRKGTRDIRKPQYRFLPFSLLPKYQFKYSFLRESVVVFIEEFVKLKGVDFQRAWA